MITAKGIKKAKKALDYGIVGLSFVSPSYKNIAFPY